MHMRRNDPRDFRAFAELNISWIRELHRVEPSDQHMYDHPESYAQSENSIFAALEDGNVVGVCALKQDEDGEFELTKMAVDSRFQGRGIGKKLIDAVEDFARNELGVDRIYLISNTINAAAIRLYERCGWTTTFEGSHPRYQRANVGMEKYL